ncbi:MAG: NAD(+) synthase [Rhodospirillales bacterium]|nr:NAD(+) synthase [Rhodospirillales bacterium]
MPTPPLSAPAALALDCPAEARRIAEFLVHTVARRLHRRGLVLGVSGGIDSAVCLALAVQALGPDRVFALLMPEADSSDDDATARARRLCESLRVAYAVEDITAALDGAGCYRRRDEAIRRILPDFGTGWRHKIVLSDAWTARDAIPFFNLVAESPSGGRLTLRMPREVYLQVVAATNFKQRIRKTLEYYHAERLNYAVLGTPNRLEYELGFFVRGGDGLADLKPIAHLYKTQVYALAGHLGVPEEIRRQPPSTDTYSLPQTQEEFYFALPYDKADLLLHAMNTGLSPASVAPALGLEPVQVERACRDFQGKRRHAARTLREAWLVEEIVLADKGEAA